MYLTMTDEDEGLPNTGWSDQERTRLQVERETARSDPRHAKDLAKALPTLMRQNRAQYSCLVRTRGEARHTRMGRRAQRAITGKIELLLAKKARERHFVAKLELTGERLALLMQQAATGKVQQKQGTLKDGSGGALWYFGYRS